MKKIHSGYTAESHKTQKKIIDSSQSMLWNLFLTVEDSVSKNENDKTGVDITMSVTEYDTSMPIDSTTGRPPLKKEINFSGKLKKEKSINEFSAHKNSRHLSEESNQSIKEESGSDINAKESAAYTLEKKSNSLPLAYILGIIGLGAAIIYCYKKKINPLKLFI